MYRLDPKADDYQGPSIFYFMDELCLSFSNKRTDIFTGEFLYSRPHWTRKEFENGTEISCQ